MSALIDDPMDGLMCDKNGIGGDLRDAEDIANIKQIVDNLTIMRLTLENKRLHDTLDNLLNVLSKCGGAEQVHAVLEIIKKMPVPPAVREVLTEGSAESWKQKAEIAYQQADRYKTDYIEACQLVAQMYQAATGTTSGPIRGVVEDMEDLRTALTAAREEAEDGRRYVSALVEAMPYEVFCGLVDAGKVNGIREWLEEET